MPASKTSISPKILTIKPSYSHNKGTCIAIFDEITEQIVANEVLFAPNQIKLAQQTRQFWDTQVGTKHEPKTLCIEYPQTFSSRTLMILGMLCAHIENEFSPLNTLRTHSSTWNTRVP